MRTGNRLKALLAASACLMALVGEGRTEDLTIAAWGGALQDVYREVYFKPYAQKSGTNVLEDTYLGGWAQFETMKQTLEAGDGLKISGFGKFDVRRKNARRGRNPKTEDALIIPERTVVTFKASQVLKAAVAGDPVAAGAATDDDSAVDDDEDEDLDDAGDDEEEG